MKTNLVRIDYVHIFFIAFCLLLGAFLRFWQLDQEGLRLDEAQSVWQASHSLQFIRNYMLQNVHLPLHNSLLHLWMNFFGSSEIAVRVFSAAPGFLTLPVIYFLAKEIFEDKDKALLALFLATISPFWIWYSREIRMYTFLTLFASLSYLLYLKFLKTQSIRLLLLYTLVNVIGVYTHYFFGFVLLTQIVHFTLFRQTEAVSKKRTTIFLVGSAFVLLLLFSPWLYLMITEDKGVHAAPTLDRPTSFNLVLSIFQFTLGYQPEYITSALVALWPVVILVGFVFLEKRQNPITPKTYLLLIGTFLPIIIVYLVSILYKPIYLTRYLMPATPMYYILLAWAFSEIRKQIFQILLPLYVLLVVASFLYQRNSIDNPAKENYREAVAFLEQTATDRDVLVIAPPYTIYPIEYYYNGRSKVTTMPIWNSLQELTIPEITPARLEDDSTSIQAGHQRIFLLVTLDLKGGYAVKEYLDLNYKKLESHQFSKFIQVEVYQAEYPASATNETT